MAPTDARDNKRPTVANEDADTLADVEAQKVTIERLAKIQRQHSPKQVIDVGLGGPLPDCPWFPTSASASTSTRQEITPPPPLGASTTIGPVLAAINALTKKIDNIDLKTDAIEPKMASKTDLKDLETSILRNTKIQIAEAVDPLKTEICDINQRVNALEAKPSTAASSQPGNTSVIPHDVKLLLDSLDPAHKQITFHGFFE